MPSSKLCTFNIFATWLSERILLQLQEMARRVAYIGYLVRANAHPPPNTLPLDPEPHFPEAVRHQWPEGLMKATWMAPDGPPQPGAVRGEVLGERARVGLRLGFRV